MLDRLFPYAATTHGVTVRVAANFLPEQSNPVRGTWVWAYHIRIENHRPAPVQLLIRHWKITDAMGQVQRVEGEGVVGEQPVIAPGGSHDYVSGCPLATPHGAMQGSYTMQGPDGLFLVDIPRFELVAEDALP